MSSVLYYVTVAGQTIGPATEQQVLDAIRAGKVSRSADICRVGESNWRYVHEVDPFTHEFGTAPVPPPPPPRAPQETLVAHAPHADSHSVETREPPTLTAWMVVATVVAFASAVTIGALGLIQLALPESRMVGAWNVAVTAVYVGIGVGTLRRRRTAYEWGLGSNVLNIILTVLAAVLGEPSVLLCLVPIWLTGVTALLLSADQFPKRVPKPNERGVRWASLGPVGKVVVGLVGLIGAVAVGLVGLSLSRRLERRTPSAESIRPAPTPARAEVGELIVGTWVREGFAPEVYEADGMMRIGRAPPGTYEIQGTVNDATLLTVTALGALTWDVSFPDDNTMRCNSLVYRRADPAAAAAVAAADDPSTLIVGTWRSSTFVETYGASGSYAINGQTGIYAVAGHRTHARLRTRVRGGEWRTWLVSFPSNDTMIVTAPERTTGIVYQRVR